MKIFKNNTTKVLTITFIILTIYNLFIDPVIYINPIELL